MQRQERHTERMFLSLCSLHTLQQDRRCSHACKQEFPHSVRLPEHKCHQWNHMPGPVVTASCCHDGSACALCYRVILYHLHAKLNHGVSFVESTAVCARNQMPCAFKGALTSQAPTNLLPPVHIQYLTHLCDQKLKRSIPNHSCTVPQSPHPPRPSVHHLSFLPPVFHTAAHTRHSTKRHSHRRPQRPKQRSTAEPPNPSARSCYCSKILLLP